MGATRTYQKVPVPLDARSVCLGPDGAVAHVTRTLHMISGRWKMPILFRLYADSTMRSSQLLREIEGISQKMLTQHLRELEQEGLIDRRDFGCHPIGSFRIASGSSDVDDRKPRTIGVAQALIRGQSVICGAREANHASCPGSFRTDWAGRSMVRTERSIADYDSLFDPIREARQAVSGKQLGDPDKLAVAVLTPVGSDNPPPQLFLSSDAYKHVSARIERLQQEIDAWKSMTLSTDG